MAEYSFPHTSVDGDRVVSADMWRDANKAIGLTGWGFGLEVTRDEPTGAVFTVATGAAWLDGVAYTNTANLTVAGTSSVGTHGIILRFGTDRNAEIVWVSDYANNQPSYAHVLLYTDIQGGTFTLTDNRAASKVEAIHDRAGAVTNNHLAGSITQDKITSLPTTKLTGTVPNEKIASGLDASKLTNGTLPIDRIGFGAIKKNQMSKLYAQTGTGTFPSIAAGASSTITINFSTPFSATPTVVATPITYVPSVRNIGVSDITNSSFKMTYTNGAVSTAGGASVNWIAIDTVN